MDNAAAPESRKAGQFAVSADNRRRLEAASRWIETLPSDSQLLFLAPHRGAADDFARQVCRRRGGLWGVHRLTPAQLASFFATPELAAQGRAPVSRLGVEALAARSIHICRARSQLDYFEPVADMPGFARALAKTVLELRLEQVSPQSLAESGLPGRDLSRLLETYQQELTERRLADFATLIKTALDAIRSDRPPAASDSSGFRIPTLFLDLSPTSSLERAFLKAVFERAPQVFATALKGDEDSSRTLQGMLGMSPLDLDRDSVEDPAARQCLLPGSVPETPRALDSVRRWIFSPQDVPSRPPDDSVEFFSAPGEGREGVEIARRIRNASEQGTPFDQIAILLRDPGTYLPLIEDALRRARIPAFFTQGTIRPDPVGRAFLALLACAAERLTASRFAEYLSLGQLPRADEKGRPPQKAVSWVAPQEGQLTFATLLDERPAEQAAALQPSLFPDPQAAQPPAGEDSETDQSPVIAGSLRTPFQWEQLLTDAAVIGGNPDRWKRRLEGLQNELGKRIQALSGEDDPLGDHLQNELERLRHLKRFALPLVEKLSQLPASASWGEWLPLLRHLAAMSLQRPDAVLSVLAELEPMEKVGPVDLDEVRQVLTERLTFLRVESPDRRYGKVFVGTLEEASACCFERVFVPGLAEGSFPRKAFEDPLLLDEYREAVSPALARQEERFARERLLLRIALGAAARQLTVSYPRMDAVQGRPRVPSFYALDILRAAEGQLPEVHQLEKRAALAARAHLGWPAPFEPEDAIDDAEHDLSVLESLLRQKGSVTGRARYLMGVNSHLARSLRTRARRWRNFWSQADGVVEPGEETLKLLAAQSPRQRSYSPTALQHFAACPYRFLLSAIHRLRPREEPIAIEQLDPLTRGSLFHAVQFELFQQLRQDGLLPFSQSKQEQILDRADEVLNRVSAQYEEELAPAIPRVWSSQIEDIRTDLRGWIRQVSRQQKDWKPVHFEYGFGLSDRRQHDPGSSRQEAEVLGGLRLRGSIDLIEQNLSDGHLRVVDHKTGLFPNPAPRYVGGGEHLQPLLYALSAESLFESPVDSGSLFYCTQRGGFRHLEIPLDDEARRRAREVLKTVGKEVERGFLPAAPRKDACKFCDFIAVCGPYEEYRLSRKLRPPLRPLEKIRQLQ
ncbi:MAG: PD-(D/E)XK nuclease family protein [Acidobacteriota bacterium]